MALELGGVVIQLLEQHRGEIYHAAYLWNKARSKQGYFPVPPTDSFQDIRTEMVLELQKVGVLVETQHHEVVQR